MAFFIELASKIKCYKMLRKRGEILISVIIFGTSEIFYYLCIKLLFGIAIFSRIENVVL